MAIKHNAGSHTRAALVRACTELNVVLLAPVHGPWGLKFGPVERIIGSPIEVLETVENMLHQRKHPGAKERDTVQRSKVVKFFTGGAKRTISGIATTSALDRMGDIVMPKGAKFKLPLPLLWQHDHSVPVGKVTRAAVQGDGIMIVAELAEGVGRADEVWAMVESGLTDAFSIGFRGLESEPLPGGGLRFTEWELLEVSIVTIPANPDAHIVQEAAA